MRLAPVLVLVVACGTPLARLPDSGTPAVDSGVSQGMDSGAPDAGTQQDVDSGTPPNDAGSERVAPPALPIYSGGTCPTWPTSGADVELNDGGTVTTVRNFMTHGVARELKIVVPRNYDPARAYPLVVAWHFLNASAGTIIDDGELRVVTEQLDFIAVAPEHKKNANGNKTYQFNWPFVEGTLDPASPAAEEELGFLDDVLACMSQSHHIDPARIHAMGASAGGLWATYVMQTPRANHIASLLSISGGLGRETILNTFDMKFHAQTNKYPALVLWGGPNDTVGISFADASTRLRDALVADNHFVVTCEHMSGHAIPPIPPPPSGAMLAPLYEFLMAHPYGMKPKTSPWQQAGLPAAMPPWCKIFTP